MLEWMILPLKRYAEFTGRSRRMEFWSFFLLSLIVTIVITGIKMATGTSMTSVAMSNPGNVMAIYGSMYSGVGILLALWQLGTLIPNIALNIRRLHDRDMSGWWFLGLVIGMIIPILNFFVIIAYLVLMLLPGTRGPNRFGPDPKDPASVAAFE